jgi:NADPH-dependent curcumin reductase CurA
MSSLPAVNRQILYAKRPEGMPTLDCFKLESGPIPTIKTGEVLIRNHYLSVDPYIRMRMEAKDSYAPVMQIGEKMVGRTIGQVVQTQDNSLQVGDWVVGRMSWEDVSAAPVKELQKIDPSFKPLSAFLGALGSTGLTAWVGLMAFGKPVTGETVLVSVASGAVGSVVGQLAKLRGCRAVGIAGGARKCEIVVKELGFDACIDYKSPEFEKNLAQAVPGGVDVYFDNVGGPITDYVLTLLNLRARVALCGTVSQYNATELYGIKNYREFFNKRVSLHGFVLSDHRDLWPEATREIQGAYRAGKLKHLETVAEGLENAPQAFIDMLNGANVGKQIVRIV